MDTSVQALQTEQALLSSDITKLDERILELKKTLKLPDGESIDNLIHQASEKKEELLEKITAIEEEYATKKREYEALS